MRKLRSKKGLTLVELLVTVAILGIVSGFSITIVVTAMNNYTEAAMMQKDQDTALMLEDYIVRNARVARIVNLLKKTGTVSVPSDSPDYQGFYIAKIDDVIETFDYAGMNAETGNYDYASTSPQKYTRFTYENVQKITFDFVRQKNSTDDTDAKSVYCLNYSIAMMSGYKLVGQVIMNNADGEYLERLSGGGARAAGFVDPIASCKLIEVTDGTSYVITPDYDVAVIFK